MPDEPLTDELLAGVLVHGPRPVFVSISDYDPAWPARFAARAGELRAVLGDRARLVEHIGSTSVPGLAAEPTVDIVVGIDDPDDEAAYLPDLEAAGYEWPDTNYYAEAKQPVIDAILRRAGWDGP